MNRRAEGRKGGGAEGRLTADSKKSYLLYIRTSVSRTSILDFSSAPGRAQRDPPTLCGGLSAARSTNALWRKVERSEIRQRIVAEVVQRRLARVSLQEKLIREWKIENRPLPLH